MNEMIRLYDSIHMPQELQMRILHPVTTRRHQFRPALAAAVLAVLCLIGCSPAVRDMLVTAFPELDLTIYQQTTAEGDSMVVCVDTEKSTFAHAKDGRLYFTGNGENLDITEKVTEAAPFFYVYEDQGYEIYMAVGYEGTLENFGTYEFLKKDGAWFTGTGRNFLSNVDEGLAYPWVQVVWDTLDIPWPMPSVILQE